MTNEEELFLRDLIDQCKRDIKLYGETYSPMYLDGAEFVLGTLNLILKGEHWGWRNKPMEEEINGKSNP